MKDYLFYLGSVASVVKRGDPDDPESKSTVQDLHSMKPEEFAKLKQPITVIRRSDKPVNLSCFKDIIEMVYHGEPADKALAVEWLEHGEGLFETETE